MIAFDLCTNDAEALLRHCRPHRSQSGDVREDRRLDSALVELAEALEAHLASDAGQREDERIAQSERSTLMGWRSTANND